MALIKCPKCNHEISDTIKKCIHCGAKIQKQTSVESDKKVNSTVKEKTKAIKAVEVKEETIKPTQVKPTTEQKENKSINNKFNYKKILVGVLFIILLIEVILASIKVITWFKESNYKNGNDNQQTSPSENTEKDKDNSNYNYTAYVDKAVLYTIDYCSHCEKFQPIVENLASKLNFQLEVKKDDKDNPSAEVLDGYPTLLFYKDGKMVLRHEGYVSEEKLISILKDNDLLKE